MRRNAMKICVSFKLKVVKNTHFLRCSGGFGGDSMEKWRRLQERLRLVFATCVGLRRGVPEVAGFDRSYLYQFLAAH